MGMAKQAMLEAEEYVWEETTVEFTCPECKKFSDGDVEIPKVDEEFSNEIDINLEVQCIWCDETFDAMLSLHAGNCSIVLNEYEGTKVEFEPVFFSSYMDDDYWQEEYYFNLPDDPLAIFQSANTDVVSFSNKFGENDGHHAVNRMIFMQSFSGFEAYLCDTFLNLVFLNDDNQKLFIRQHKNMKNVSFSISDLLEHKDLPADEIIKKKITHVIKTTLFHNLTRAIALFGIYEIEMFSDKKEKDLLFKAVEHRHHCVHRNGRDLEGNPLDVFTKEYCQEVASAMLSSAEFVKINITRITRKIADDVPF